MTDEVRVKRDPRRPLRRAALGAACAAAVALAPAAARAQQRTFYLDRLFIGGAPDDYIGMWRPELGDKTRFFGQLALGFGYEPFRIENEIQNSFDQQNASNALGQPVKTQLMLYADFGVEIWNRFSIQLELPAAIYESGNSTSTASAVQSTTSTVSAPNVAALGDLRLDARAVIWRTADRAFRLGAEAGVWIPTGNSSSYNSDGGASGSLGLGLEYELNHKVIFTGNLGFQFRPYNQVNSFGVQHEFRYALGALVPLRDGDVRVGGELFGSVGLSGNGDGDNPNIGSTYPAANLPLEWMAEVRFRLGEKKRWWIGGGGGTRLTPGYSPDFRLVALAGYYYSIADTAPPSPGQRFKMERFADHGADRDHDNIPDDIDLCPDEPEDHKPPNPDDGCPAPPDRDGDGIPDNVDKCPDEPEDFDGIQDADGCPEDDADKDGIPDAQDACPLEPGEPDPDPKKNGCPKFIRRIAGSTEIQLLKNIEFATGKAVILPKSYPIVDEVVRLLKVNPDIRHLAIEGHTDNRGSDQLNEKLSNDRANAVMKYIVEHGIDAGRLSAAGYGPKRPIADNNTADGRQRNRRVEFHITDQAGVTPPAGAAPPAPPK